jgi:hypothetical protein
MSEISPLPPKDGLERLLHDIEIERARIPLLLELAELTLERSDIIWEKIQEDIERDQQETEEAVRTLRKAGLLKD